MRWNGLSGELPAKGPSRLQQRRFYFDRFIRTIDDDHKAVSQALWRLRVPSRYLGRTDGRSASNLAPTA